MLLSFVNTMTQPSMRGFAASFEGNLHIINQGDRLHVQYLLTIRGVASTDAICKRPAASTNFKNFSLTSFQLSNMWRRDGSGDRREARVSQLPSRVSAEQRVHLENNGAERISSGAALSIV